MAGERWCPPPEEVRLGLGFYASDAPGVAGRLKSSPEAFRVTEVSSYPYPEPDGPVAVLRVASRGWEQHELAAAIARRMGLPEHALAWSGTKDRRALAERLFSYRGPLPPADLGLRDVTIVEAYRARDGLVFGHHYGNTFEIDVAEVSADPSAAQVAYQRVAAELRQRGGCPNFFGPQRFGEVRPITHEIGRWLVRGDLPRAVEAYLVDQPEDARAGTGDDARQAYAQHRDPVRALREFPPEYRFERSILERLARGQPPDRAFRALSRELRTLFVHAYQSWIFNEWVTARHRAGLPLERPVPGDRIVRLARDGTTRGTDASPVETDNLRECGDLVARGRAFVAGPLVGFETPPGSGVPGSLLDTILVSEGIDRSQFRLPGAPEIASRGSWRPVLVPLPPLGMTPTADGVRFRFALPKGTYATVLLREFLKNGAVELPDAVPSSRAY